MKKEEHLPETGVGPYYVGLIILMTVTGICLSVNRIIHTGNAIVLHIPFLIMGFLFILTGIIVYIMAMICISDHIVKNELVTTGIYGYTRNPIYTAFLMVCTGAILLTNDLWLLLLPILYWLMLTILMKLTEEKWLKALYGDPYLEYCRHVNRCIIWIRKK